MNEETLFHEALTRATPEERAAFLAEACARRPELRLAVEALLAAHEQPGNFLSHQGIAVANETGASPNSDPQASETDIPLSRDTENRNRETDPVSLQASPATVEAVNPKESLVPAVPAAADTSAPKRIGRYVIRRLLGRGGMGSVYLAHDPELDRPVALKVPKLAGPDAEERFLREARTAAAVTHPNLCPVYDAGRTDGVLYLTMAYVPGSTLTEIIREKGPFLPAQAAAVATGIALGMAEAHRHGIVHRDLKPGNILLDRRGEPVVTDFGLALRAPVPVDVVDPAMTVDHQPRLTQSGILMGTPAYMPPEQARGELDRIGPASDVYALGAILFELITGTPPFPPAPLFEIVRLIESQPPPAVSMLRRGVPAGLDAVCQRAMAKDPAKRFATMEDFVRALAPYAARDSRRRWVRVAVAATVLLLLLAFAGVMFYVRTDYGTVEVRLSDPRANVQVTVDGKVIEVTEDGRVTRLRAGPHGLEVKGPSFETESRSFKVTRGETKILELMLHPKNSTLDRSMPPKSVPPELTHERARLAELLAQGRRLIQDLRYSELGPIAEEALKIDPESPGALSLRATFRDNRGDRPGARADAELALKLNPETVQALFVRGVVSGSSGKLDDAIADLTAAIRLDPKLSGLWTMRAKAYLDRKEYRQVVADATNAIDLGFPRYDAHANRAAAYVHLGEYEKALADLNAVLERSPGNVGFLVQRSVVHARLGNVKQAADDWATARKIRPTLSEDERPTIPDPPKSPKRKKLTADETTAFSVAMNAAETAWRRDLFDDCGKAIDEAMRIDPTSAKAREFRARLLTRRGRISEALKEVNEAIHLDPKYAYAYFVRGTIRSNSKDPAGAIADLTIGLRLERSDAQAWNNRGWAYMLRDQYHQALADLNEAIGLRRDSGTLANRGMCYLHLGDYKKALSDYQKAADLQPTVARWPRLCAVLCAKLGDIEGAQGYRKRAIAIDRRLEKADPITLPEPLPAVKSDPERSSATPKVVEPPPSRDRLASLLARGRRMLNRGRFADMARAADDALKEDPQSPGALSLRATFRAFQNDLEGAQKDAEAALKLNPQMYEALIVRAFVNGEDGKPDDAIADETVALRLNPTHARGWANRAKSYLDRKEYRQAIADATRAIELSNGPDARLCRGGAYACLGDYKKALSDYKEAAKLGPNDWRVFDQRSAVHAKMGNTAKEMEDWAKAKRLNPSLRIEERVVLPDPPKAPQRKKLTPDETKAFAAALQAAQDAWDQTHFADCAKAAEEAMRIDPTSAAAQEMRARLLAQRGRFDEALKAADEAIVLDPTYARAYFVRGTARSNLNHPAAAIADITIGLRLDPTIAYPWNNRGWAYMMRHQYHQALADLNEAVRLKDDAEVRSNRGMCYLHLGDYANALKDYNKAAERQPSVARWRLISAAIRAKMGDNEGARKDRQRAIAIDPELKGARITLPDPLPPKRLDPESPAQD